MIGKFRMIHPSMPVLSPCCRSSHRDPESQRHWYLDIRKANAVVYSIICRMGTLLPATLPAISPPAKGPSTMTKVFAGPYHDLVLVRFGHSYPVGICRVC